MAEIRGQLISRKYRLLSVLGEGAMGVVYRAEQLDAERQPLREVALKMVQPGFSRDPGFAQRFLREVRVAAKLRSPHIVTVHDTSQSEDGQLYYAMELVQGPTLKEVLQRHGPLPVGRVVRIVGQVCEALAEAHSLAEPVVHRDLKPANLFVETRQGQAWVKVGDFGIAKVLGEHTSGLTHTGASPGTPRYMAPEQWMGKEVDGRADLYALGIMLYEMLTGRAPFAGDEGPLALMYQHLHEAPAALPGAIPVGIRFQVERLLAKTPQERPANALQVRHALEAALSGEDERSTFIVDGGKKASVVETEVETRVPHLQGQSEQTVTTLDRFPHSGVATQRVVTPSQSKARRPSLWRYGVAGGLLVVAVVVGSQYRAQQPAEEVRPQPAVEQRVPEQQTPQSSLGQAQQPLQGQASQQQAKGEPPRVVEAVEQEAEERKRAEAAQQVAALSERASQQRAAKRLTTPAGDNAVETYRELLKVAPGHEETLAGLNEIKGQYRQWAEEAQQRGEWAKAQAHYEMALKIDPQDGALSAALQQAKEARQQAEAIAGWYQTTVSTPLLKEPRPNAAVIAKLSPQKRVHVAGAVGDYLRIESVRGNPPGYVARKNVAPVQAEPVTADYAGISKSAPPISQVEVRKNVEEEPKRKLENAIVGKWEESIHRSETIEFFRDGTLIIFEYRNSIKRRGNYKVLDDNRFWFEVADVATDLLARISGNQLVVTGSPGGRSVVYERVR